MKLFTSLLASCFFTLAIAQTPQIKLRIIETSDIHAYYTAYDYLKDQAVEHYGLTRTATLIKQARAQVSNSVLIDNGDLIQGGLIGTWAVENNFQSYHLHPAYQAFAYLQYDVSNLGNHEFNFGLPYLQQVISSSQQLTGIPIINANVYDAVSGKNTYTPYVIQDKKVVDSQGNYHILKIGYIGFTPPAIMRWDADKLTGKVITAPIVETAEKFIPEMQAQGAQIIIAIPHSGIGVVAPSSSLFEDQVINLTKVPGIDAVVFGHSHAVYPSIEFSEIEGTNIERGLINGVPAVMPGRWGDHIGIIDLTLVQDAQGQWQVDPQQSIGFTRAIYDWQQRQPLVDEDQELVALLEPIHQQVRAYANGPRAKENAEVGQVASNLYGYLALTQDDYVLKLINQAQMYSLEQWVQSQGQTYQGYRLLATQAPFKYGERHNDITNFTVIDKGVFTLRNVSDAYMYPNTLNIIQITGLELKNWLECASGQFNQINPQTTVRQELLNYQTFRTYNFDVFYGVTYQIDVTKPAKYTSTCKETNTHGAGRILNLTYKDGTPVTDSDKILVATNNYRANGAILPGTGAEKIVFASQTSLQDTIMDYIAQITANGKEVSIDFTPSWSFLPISNGEQLNVVIYSAPDEKAVNWSLQNSVWPLTKL
ncbi:bifunctional 2',3'-cyclic-nucleotide 2'-phosphodiesterase/3'-nucleotidase, partial [Psittacicella gerlachiana]